MPIKKTTVGGGIFITKPKTFSGMDAYKVVFSMSIMLH